MTTLNKILVGVVVILAILGAIAFFRDGKTGFGATTFQQGEVQNNPFIFVNGFSAGSSQQLGVDSSGNLNAGAITSTSFVNTSSGTSTLSFLSTSATKGFCINLNATSTNTTLNLTATTTTSSNGSQSGLLLKYGACQ